MSECKNRRSLSQKINKKKSSLLLVLSYVIKSHAGPRKTKYQIQEEILQETECSWGKSLKVDGHTWAWSKGSSHDPHQISMTNRISFHIVLPFHKKDNKHCKGYFGELYLGCCIYYFFFSMIITNSPSTMMV